MNELTVICIQGFPNPLYGVMTKDKAQQQLRKQIEVEKEGGVRIAIEELPPSPSPRYQEAVSNGGRKNPPNA